MTPHDADVTLEPGAPIFRRGPVELIHDQHPRLDGFPVATQLADSVLG